ncbi:BaiN/RdsA family NAD(P)/FAD-dependent oxidoreductase [Aeoliella mucimassa]|uniref:N-methyltryptophan oxidase n=1 Tax=Aeoliella mucimassa TaxID=2527972 RepID=A0A518AJQ0_9BACT|nr:NAD(P)/FAD-dependent oxidoreductase [Aeoliella mucimassa]QDU54950.1 N-methyltryptophan oxidase [Aeoliella mucimassa]
MTPRNDSADVVIVGAGAAGLMAAARAANRGRRVVLLEKNNKPGAKILMSGGTRCNLTHATDRRTLADAFPREQARFLRSPLAALGPEELVEYFHAAGLSTKVAETGKVFPTSDRALDVQLTLLKLLKESGAQLALGEAVSTIERTDQHFTVATSKRTLQTPQVILATGGQSYPGCGTTGDGYVWAKHLGHSIVPPRPALVPLKTSEDWLHELSGLTMPDVTVSAFETNQPKPLARDRGSLLFTHFGLSGPAAMNVSRAITATPKNHLPRVELDLLPDVTEEQLVQELKQLSGKRVVRGYLAERLPTRLADALLQVAQVPLDRQAAEFGKKERAAIVRSIKHLSLATHGTLGFVKAEVTAGGVALDEVDSRDMQSKCCEGLYLIGEVLDIDGPIGGYNFQAAFSTGWLAGERV